MTDKRIDPRIDMPVYSMNIADLMKSEFKDVQARVLKTRSLSGLTIYEFEHIRMFRKYWLEFTAFYGKVLPGKDQDNMDWLLSCDEFSNPDSSVLQ